MKGDVEINLVDTSKWREINSQVQGQYIITTWTNGVVVMHTGRLIGPEAYPSQHEPWCADWGYEECTCDLCARKQRWDAENRTATAAPLPVMFLGRRTKKVSALATFFWKHLKNIDRLMKRSRDVATK